MQEQNPALTSAPMPTTAPVSPSPASGSFNAAQATSKKKLPLKMILGALVLILLVVGAGAGYYLTQINQDVRQQASGTPYTTCVPGQGTYPYCVGNELTSCNNGQSIPINTCPNGCQNGACVATSTKCPAGWTDTGTNCSKQVWVRTAN